MRKYKNFEKIDKILKIEKFSDIDYSNFSKKARNSNLEILVNCVAKFFPIIYCVNFCTVTDPYLRTPTTLGLKLNGYDLISMRSIYVPNFIIIAILVFELKVGDGQTDRQTAPLYNASLLVIEA